MRDNRELRHTGFTLIKSKLSLYILLLCNLYFMQAELDTLTAENGSTGTGSGDGKNIDGKTETKQKHHPLLLQVSSCCSSFCLPLFGAHHL